VAFELPTFVWKLIVGDTPTMSDLAHVDLGTADLLQKIRHNTDPHLRDLDEGARRSPRSDAPLREAIVVSVADGCARARPGCALAGLRQRAGMQPSPRASSSRSSTIDRTACLCRCEQLAASLSNP
jgi:hypothetical protein